MTYICVKMCQPFLGRVIYNVIGKKVYEERIYRYQGESKVNTSGWQKGMYFAVVYSAGKAVGKCKFVLLR